MNAPRARVGGIARLSVALLATICMLARAVLPMPAEAHGSQRPDLELRILGAALCHADDGPTAPDQAPIAPLSCDHCLLCAAAVHAPLAVPAEIAAPAPPPARADGPVPSGWYVLAIPRAPPEHARNPRAPPAV